jgi:hypothetical protein
MPGGLFGKFQTQREDEDLEYGAGRGPQRPAQGPAAGAMSGNQQPSGGPTMGMPPGTIPTGPASPEQMAMVNVAQPGDGDGSLRPSDIAELMAAMNARSGELQGGQMPEQPSDIDLALRGGQPFSPDDLAQATKPDFSYGQMANPFTKLLMLHAFQQQQRGGSGNPWD